MSGKERRLAPRKVCAIPLRFRLLTHLVPVGAAVASAAVASADAGGALVSRQARPRTASRVGIQEGQSVNLSERGIYFKSSMKLNIGEPIEMFFTLPTELTGRSPEAVRCDARVVHIDYGMDGVGTSGVGAVIERFEPLRNMRSWDN